MTSRHAPSALALHPSAAPPPGPAPVFRAALLPLGVLAVLLSSVSTPVAAAAQSTEDDRWNEPQVLELVRRARALRQSNAVDPEFRSYTAEARGYVYFFMDRPDSAEQVLVKADQVALDVWWRAPNATRQTIVGLRDEKVLPTDIRYHLDHLTVVQDDFGDRIRLGDGDEVESVVHPMGPGSESVYDFLLFDSLRIAYGGSQEVRVWEVRVRPKDAGGPGFVGSVYLDRDRAAIVRMSFSFTPASYVDPSLDYIRVSLDNSLWMESWWLPWRQEIEIRREIALLDFMAGSVIRGRYRIDGYDFNVDLPAEAFRGRSVRSVSPAEREAFPFEEGLFADLEESGGLRPSPAIEEVEEQVREVVKDRVMSGLKPVRLYGARLSDFVRYDRAEGLYLGAGASFRPVGTLVLRATGGWAIGRERGQASLNLSRDVPPDIWSPEAEGYWDALGDIGGNPGSTLLENTISSVAGSKDYMDPFFRRGGSVRFGRGGRSPLSITARLEEHVAARDVVSDGPDTEFRPVRSVDEGTMAALELRLGLGLPGSGRMNLTSTGARFEDQSFGSLSGELRWAHTDPRTRWSGLVAVEGGLTHPGAPPQSAWLLGGRYTLLGHDYRGFVGSAYWLARVEGTVPVWSPWLGIRAFAAAGSTYLRGMTLPADWEAADTDGVRASVGLGLSMGWDVARFDVGYGLRGGGWEAMFSVAPQFRAWL